MTGPSRPLRIARWLAGLALASCLLGALVTAGVHSRPFFSPPALLPPTAVPPADEVAATSARAVAQLALAFVRAEIPLAPSEALVEAVAARRLGWVEVESWLLTQAAAFGPLAQVARVEQAQCLRERAPSVAAALAADALRERLSPQLRDAAVEVLAATMASLERTPRRELERLQLPSAQQRQLELAAALSDPAPTSRSRLRGLLEEGAGDAVALAAAQALGSAGELQAHERFLVAQAYFNHGLFAVAETWLADLEVEPDVPSWEVALLHGRCRFRAAAFDDACAWYELGLGLATVAEDKARLAVHLGRAHELAGRVDDAVQAVRRGVGLRASDERRLYLATLRLRQGRLDLATRGVGEIRDRDERGRGEILLAVGEARAGQMESARRRLRAISRGEWRGPAAVLAAGLAATEEDWQTVVESLDAAGEAIGPFWSLSARQLFARVSPEQVTEWRLRMQRTLVPAVGRPRLRVLARWAALECDDEPLEQLRQEVVALLEPGDSAVVPAPSGLAAQLWRQGLREDAVRWHPDGMPSGGTDGLWSARHFLELGVPWRAVAAAEAVQRDLAQGLPPRVLPRSLAEPLFPLPTPTAVVAAARLGGAPWQLLAAVVREESRWRPTAVSQVGARGLMQLMPATAAAAAERIGLPPPSLAELDDASLSLTLGASELGRLLERFEGRHAPAVAAYNAGELQAALWLELCGAPCSDEEYVACIAFADTRSYTTQVLASAAAYDEIYGLGFRAESG